MLVVTGLMVRQAAIYAVEIPDGFVYLVGLEVDHYWPSSGSGSESIGPSWSAIKSAMI